MSSSARTNCVLSCVLSVAIIGFGLPARAQAQTSADERSQELDQRLDDDESFEADTPRFEWIWPEFHPLEAVLTSGSLVGLLVVNQRIERTAESDWTGVGPVDQWVRDRLVGATREARDRADVASDILWYTSSAVPFVDSFLVLTIHESPAASLEMFALVAEANLVTGFLSRLLQRAIRRPRPLLQGCDAEGVGYSPLCESSAAYSSLASGHTATAFTGAGLTCAFHQHLDLWGDGVGGTIACLSTVALATGTGVARLVSDRHWFSDIILGSAIGFASGYGLPWLLHFRFDDSEDAETATAGPRSVLLPWASETEFGLAWAGFF